MFKSLTLGSALLLGSTVASAQAPAHIECNRACLAGFMTTYLDALVHHDPSKLPTTKNVKYTENGVRLNLTDGLWQTASALPDYRINILDEEAGSVALVGVITENGIRNFFATRLKIEQDKKVSEIENLVVRNVSGGNNNATNAHEQHPLFSEPVPQNERLSRAELVKVGNSYFSGLDNDDSGQFVPFDPDCQRRENGGIMANDPKAAPDSMQHMGCKDQFDTGFSVIVTNIRQRRFVAVDPDYGLVFAFGFFDHDGTVAKFSRTLDHKLVDVAPTFRQPFSFIIGEAFKVKKGKIRQIEAVLMTVPFGMESGW
ncbi:MAG TPA: hypothetical protein VMH83_02890 [Candidatus Acidoferrum sp.]|nr:hypothetical protein [Candidatus Acidoferrum sp.]